MRTLQRSERGAALVEFALILPLFMMLVLGMFTGGLAYNQKNSIATAAREGARYGATLPKAQYATSAEWLAAVQQLVVDRSAGDLDGPGNVCVAIVRGTSPVVVSGGYTTRPGQACYVDGSTDAAERVQVSVRRGATIQALFFTRHITLSGDATARYEQ